MNCPQPGWLALVLAMGLGCAGLAAEPVAYHSLSPTNPAALKVEVRVDGGPGVLPARRAYLTAGTNRFAFLLPTNFRLNSTDATQVQLVTADYGCTLTVGLLPNSSPQRLTPAAGRELLQTRFPSPQIEAESTLAAAGQSGPAFDLRRAGPGGITQAARVAYIPSRAGTLEFCLSTSPEKLSQMLGDLRFVMLTFCASDAQGNLKIRPLSTKL